MGKKISNEKIQELINVYNSRNNISVIDAAKIVGIGQTSARKYLKEYNIKVRTNSQNIRNEDTVNTVIKLYSEGKSEQYIEDNIGICRITIREILRNNNIQTRDNSQYRKYELNQDYFEKLDTNNKAYVLGFLYADGNVSKEKYNIQLSLQEGDKEILEKISKDMNSDVPLVFKNFSKYNDKNGFNQQDQWSLLLHSKKMHMDLAKFGIIPQKTHLIKYPEFLTEEQHSHFLRGVMDGDGCIHKPSGKNGKLCNVDICGTYDFCLGAKEIIEKYLNIHCSIILTDKNKTTYRISISGRNQVSNFLDWIYSGAELYLKRKFELYKNHYCRNVA